ncbi:MAG: UDP-N-acetylmuramoyl-L-alanine--D-glutamate ligase [Campylobacterota bacterium]
MIRVLGKGNTAQAIKKKFENVILYDESNFSSYEKNSNELTVVSPGIPPHNFMVKEAKNVISDYDLFSETMPFSIWISGTNGKTTTTQMCQHILEEKNSQCGGNIGKAVSKMDLSKPIWILETSSFTFHYIKSAKPNIYLLLPISEDHLSWHINFKNYEQAKLKPFSMMNEEDIIIAPNKYKNKKTDACLITYKNSDDLCNQFGIDKKRVDFKEPFLLDAILALISKKILFDYIDYKTVNTYKIDKHKVEEFRDKKNRLWIDDSKATNIDATINALKPYENRNIHLILGGDDKGANLKSLFEYLKNFNLTVYSIGQNENRIYEYCKQYKIDIKRCKYLEVSVNRIDKNFKNDDIAILSPAAASLDQFSSYKQRGEEFKKFVYALS